MWPSQTATRQSTTEPTTLPPTWSHSPLLARLERLEAERGEGGEAAERSRSRRIGRRGAGEHAAVGVRQRGEEADDERAEHVH